MSDKGWIFMIIPDMKFSVMNEDIVTADVEIKGGCCIFCERYTDSPATQLFPPKTVIDIDIVKRVFLGRCWEEGRVDNQQLLSVIGVEEYNPFLIVKETKGVSTNDKFWFRFVEDEALTWSVVNPRKSE